MSSSVVQRCWPLSLDVLSNLDVKENVPTMMAFVSGGTMAGYSSLIDVCGCLDDGEFFHLKYSIEIVRPS